MTADDARPPHVRFEAKIKKLKGKNACWEWTGARDGRGYPKLVVGSRTDKTRRTVSAVRFSFRFYVGPIEKGFYVWPRCQNRLCINPHHLRATNRSGLNNELVKLGRWVRVGIATTARNKRMRFPGELNGQAKLNWDQVRTIREKRKAGIKVVLLARQYSVSEPHIYSITNYKSWLEKTL